MGTDLYGSSRKRNEKLLWAVKSNGLSFEKLANAVGLSKSKLSRILNLHQRPTLDEGNAIAKVLNTTPEALGFWTNEMKGND